MKALRLSFFAGFAARILDVVTTGDIGCTRRV